MQTHHKQPTVNVAEMDKVEMAREILETGKVMELQGLKALLKDTIKNPMVPASARAHAEIAFQLAADIEFEIQWRQKELQRWTTARKVKVLDGGKVAQSTLDPSKKVLVPEYILMETSNLRQALNYEVAQIGMHAVETVYNDIVAMKTNVKRPVGVMQQHEEEDHEDSNTG